ncbi:hypothetical protein Tco_0521791 [Tanacetum coccineum]
MVFCSCGRVAVIKTSWTDSNSCHRFYACPIQDHVVDAVKGGLPALADLVACFFFAGAVEGVVLASDGLFLVPAAH